MVEKFTDKEIKELIVSSTEVDSRYISGVHYTDPLEIQGVVSNLVNYFEIAKPDKTREANEQIFKTLERIKNRSDNTAEEKQKIEGFIYNIDFDLQMIAKAHAEILEAQEDIDKQKTELKKREAKVKREEKKQQKGKFKKSGHLQDQQLKYDYPKDKKPDLFSTLNKKTMEDIETRGVKRSEVVEGIRLTSAESRVVDTLCKLLHHKSQNLDPKQEKYYTGDKAPVNINYGDKTATAPKLSFTLYEFTKEYLGKEKVGGKEIKEVTEILIKLGQKDFLLTYKEEIPLANGEKKINNYKFIRKIIDLPTLEQIHLDKKGIEISKKEETIITLHPVFRSQIDSKFILVPNDINRRTKLASGSSNVSEVTIKLRDYLMRELSNKRYNSEIGQDKLYYQVGEKWMRQSRKKMVKKYLDKALEVVKKLDLLESYKVVTAKGTGDPKVVFKLNKDFE